MELKVEVKERFEMTDITGKRKEWKMKSDKQTENLLKFREK